MAGPTAQRRGGGRPDGADAGLGRHRYAAVRNQL